MVKGIEMPDMVVDLIDRPSLLNRLQLLEQNVNLYQNIEDRRTIKDTIQLIEELIELTRGYAEDNAALFSRLEKMRGSQYKSAIELIGKEK